MPKHRRRRRNATVRVANPTRKHRRRASRTRNAPSPNPRRRRSRRTRNPFALANLRRRSRRSRNPGLTDPNDLLRIVAGSAGAVLLTWGAKQIQTLKTGPMAQYRGVIVPAVGLGLAFLIQRYDRTAAHALAAATVALAGWDFADRATGGKGLGAVPPSATGSAPLARLIEAARARQMRVGRPVAAQPRLSLAGYSVRPAAPAAGSLSGYSVMRAARTA